MCLKIPFQLTDWTELQAEEVPGTTGMARVRKIHCGDPAIEGEVLRIRIMELSAGFLLDHWCEVGHFVFVLEGEFVNELQNGDTTVMRPGMSFLVSDGLSSHRISTTNGPAKLLIVDGSFLRRSDN